MFPYIMRRLNQLQMQDYTKEPALSQLCMDNMSSDSGFLRRTIFSDECVFYLLEFTNTEIPRIWSRECPREIENMELHIEEVTAWCGGNANGVVCPYISSNEAVREVDYCYVVETYVKLQTQQFQQNFIYRVDGAPPKTTRTLRSFLMNLFQIH